MCCEGAGSSAQRPFAAMPRRTFRLWSLWPRSSRARKGIALIVALVLVVALAARITHDDRPARIRAAATFPVPEGWTVSEPPTGRGDSPATCAWNFTCDDPYVSMTMEPPWAGMRETEACAALEDSLSRWSGYVQTRTSNDGPCSFVGEIHGWGVVTRVSRSGPIDIRVSM